MSNGVDGIRSNLFIDGNYNAFTISFLYLVVNAVQLSNEGHEIQYYQGNYNGLSSSLTVPLTNYSLAFSYLIYGV